MELAASSDSLNKAGRTLGKGTTSKARLAKRASLQPHATQQDGGDDDPWKRDDGWGNDWQQGGWYQDGWDDSPWRRDDDWWGNSWKRDSESSWERDSGWWGSSWEREESTSPPPGIHLQLRSASPGDRGRSKKRRPRRRLASSSSPGGWNRDREMGLPTISEPDFSASSTPEKGKRQRNRSNSQSSSDSMVSVATSNKSGKKVWRKKSEMEAERQAWLDAKEKKPHHREASEKREIGDEVATSSTKKETPEEGEASQENTSEKKDGGKDEVKTAKKHLMVDFHNTLAIGKNNLITEENKLAMEKLLDKYDVTVCSWCFQEREKEVMEHLARQSFFPDLHSSFCIRRRTGFKGKGWMCKDMGISAMFDDAADILKDALERGIAVYPITSKTEDHSWWKAQGHNPYPTLAAAVEAFLQDEKEK